MGVFEVTRVIDAPAETVWRLVTDWDAMSRWMPLTAIRRDDGPTRVGWGFTGLTGVGRLRLADSMLVTRWDPPREFRVVKTGYLLAGSAQVSVTAMPGGACRLLWRESITLRPTAVGRLLAPVLDPLNRRLFEHVVAQLAREATA